MMWFVPVPAVIFCPFPPKACRELGSLHERGTGLEERAGTVDRLKLALSKKQARPDRRLSGTLSTSRKSCVSFDPRWPEVARNVQDSRLFCACLPLTNGRQLSCGLLKGLQGVTSDARRAPGR